MDVIESFLTNKTYVLSTSIETSLPETVYRAEYPQEIYEKPLSYFLLRSGVDFTGQLAALEIGWIDVAGPNAVSQRKSEYKQDPHRN